MPCIQHHTVTSYHGIGNIMTTIDEERGILTTMYKPYKKMMVVRWLQFTTLSRLKVKKKHTHTHIQINTTYKYNILTYQFTSDTLAVQI